jgi:hypothetical protein
MIRDGTGWLPTPGGGGGTVERLDLRPDWVSSSRCRLISTVSDLSDGLVSFDSCWGGLSLAFDDLNPTHPQNYRLQAAYCDM